MALGRNVDRTVFTIVNFSGQNVWIGHNQNVRDTGTWMGVKVLDGASWEDEHHKGEVWLWMTTSGWITVEETVKE